MAHANNAEAFALFMMLGFVWGWGIYEGIQQSLRRCRDHWYSRGHSDGVADTLRAIDRAEYPSPSAERS